MKIEKKTLDHVMYETALFLQEVTYARSQGSLRSIEEGIIPVLREHSFKAEEAGLASGDVTQKFVDQSYALRDICDEVGHPNTLKEEPCFKRIQRYFPDFAYAGADTNNHEIHPQP